MSNASANSERKPRDHPPSLGATARQARLRTELWRGQQDPRLREDQTAEYGYVVCQREMLENFLFESIVNLRLGG